MQVLLVEETFVYIMLVEELRSAYDVNLGKSHAADVCAAVVILHVSRMQTKTNFCFKRSFDQAIRSLIDLFLLSLQKWYIWKGLYDPNK